MRICRSIAAVDAHTCGEPARVIVGGVLDVPGKTILEKQCHLAEHADHLRKLMLREPRGYPAANCNLILPACHPDAVAGYVIMEQVEYPEMSGTNTIAVATVLLETGMAPAVEPITELTLESAAGLIHVRAEVEHGKVKSVTFENVPAFAALLDETIDVPELGGVRVDVAYGGMFYVIAEADQFDLELTPSNAGRITRIGEMIKAAAQEQLRVVHPLEPKFDGVTISQLSGPPRSPSADMRNVVVVSTGQLDWDRPETWTGACDRSPCGTGTCARMAALYARGKLKLNQPFRHEGVLDTVFAGELLREVDIGAPYPAVVPTITGQAWITGTANYVLDPDDPFPEGFTVGDIWGGVS
ncbi:MAG: proline racemase family protein [Pirellulaceae bacterium]|jgi:proline racemase|nr:proline racemase family protein [Pirellulaceae bacterium]MDP7019903.1 proline racemase family protein [Pirellulaceae bacterium]